MLLDGCSKERVSQQDICLEDTNVRALVILGVHGAEGRPYRSSVGCAQQLDEQRVLEILT